MTELYAVLNDRETRVPVLYDVKIRPEPVEGAGEVATVFGHFSCSFDDPSGGRVDVAMYFLLALRKESDGAWRVSREFLIEDAGGARTISA